jgi:hypothetical protein
MRYLDFNEGTTAAIENIVIQKTTHLASWPKRCTSEHSDHQLA